MDLFTKGLLLGFAIAAPVGPIGILCIRKTIQFGRLSGFFTGLGAAVADTFYGALAIFGLGVISEFLVSFQQILQLLGGLFLAYLGIKIFRSKPSTAVHAVTHITLIKDFLTTFILTLTNPMTILSFIVIFAGFGITHENTPQGILFILGVFIGSTVWWIILSEGVTFFRKKISPRTVLWINRIAGLLLLSFSLYFLTNALIISSFH
jgi:threonine/homoserine/homoserine lactone efflux protein